MAWNADSNGRCFFHSDREKDHAEFRKQFLEEVRQLRSKGSPDFNFSGFIFPDFTIEAGGIEFGKPLILRNAQMKGSFWLRKVRFESVDFEGAVFHADADFAESSFQTATFARTKFNGPARFENVDFNGPTTFDSATFGSVNFAKCRFGDRSSFMNASFAKAHFPQASFKGFAHFGDSTFNDDCYFRAAEFTTGSFLRVAFHSDANFGAVRFQEWFDFGGTQWHSWVNFADALFEGQVRFGSEGRLKTRFMGLASFDRAVFNGLTLFDEVEFDRLAVFMDSDVRARLSFQDVVVAPQGAIDFRYVSSRGDPRVEFLGHRKTLDMSRVRLLHTDSTRIRFRNIRWWSDPRRRIVFDEIVLGELQRTQPESLGRSPLLDSLAADLAGKPSNLDRVTAGTTFESVEGLYRELRRNYEDTLRYPEAGDFYVREMEMKRLGRAPGPGGRNWLRRNLSLLSFYSLLSRYGESYNRALIWIIGSVMLFASLRVALLATPSLLEALALSFGATFQISGDNLIDHVQRLWSILILALLFLAVRRRLKR